MPNMALWGTKRSVLSPWLQRKPVWPNRTCGSRVIVDWEIAHGRIWASPEALFQNHFSKNLWVDRRVLSQLDQRNLVCSNRINDNRFRAYMNSRKCAFLTVSCRNVVFNSLMPKCGFSRVKIGSGSATVYLIWANLNLKKINEKKKEKKKFRWSSWDLPNPPKNFQKNYFGNGAPLFFLYNQGLNTLLLVAHKAMLRHYGHRLHFWLKVKKGVAEK